MQTKERVCMALALYHEARGEPLTGQVGVALAVLNRAASPVYPSTICDVVFQQTGTGRHRVCQFSFTCDGRPLLPREPETFLRLLRLGAQVMEIVAGPGVKEDLPGSDPVLRRLVGRFAGVTHFHRRDIRPVWARHMKRVAQAGRHVFLSSGRVTARMPPAIRLRRLYLEAGIAHAPGSLRL